MGRDAHRRAPRSPRSSPRRRSPRPARSGPIRTMHDRAARARPASTMRLRVMKSGIPGGIMSERGSIRVTGSSRRPRAAGGTDRPPAGSPRTVRRTAVIAREPLHARHPVPTGDDEPEREPVLRAGAGHRSSRTRGAPRRASRRRSAGCARSPARPPPGSRGRRRGRRARRASSSIPASSRDRPKRGPGPLGGPDRLGRATAARSVAATSRARPLPAHSIVTAIVTLGRERRSAIESSSGSRTSPPTETLHVASSVSGTSKWISR